MLRKIYPAAGGGGGAKGLKKEVCVSDLNTSDFLEQTCMWSDECFLWKCIGSGDNHIYDLMFSEVQPPLGWT